MKVTNLADLSQNDERQNFRQNIHVVSKFTISTACSRFDQLYNEISYKFRVNRIYKIVKGDFPVVCTLLNPHEHNFQRMERRLIERHIDNRIHGIACFNLRNQSSQKPIVLQYRKSGEHPSKSWIDVIFFPHAFCSSEELEIIYRNEKKEDDYDRKNSCSSRNKMRQNRKKNLQKKRKGKFNNQHRYSKRQNQAKRRNHRLGSKRYNESSKQHQSSKRHQSRQQYYQSKAKKKKNKAAKFTKRKRGRFENNESPPPVFQIGKPRGTLRERLEERRRAKNAST